ncbi:MAG: PIN domain-containing protein [Candidatus Peregrinibacteria bacterium]|nr:PIN domain-containing protein [Candidatus Peregrinibacteria bacterium]MDZ4245206.1 PIN domain-containing protein [Candidatus Gracilibacteria bacterium]
MIFADTSFLIGYLIEEDPHHEKALEIAATIEDDLLVTHDVLKEFVTVVTYKSSSEVAFALFTAVKSSYFIQVMNEVEGHFEETMAIFDLLGHHKFSYTDCSLIAIAQMLEGEVLTFDKRLEKALE